MNRNIKRGDIFYVTEDPEHPPIGAEIWPDRAGLIVSADVFNRTSHAVMIVYLSTSEKKKPCPTHIPVTSGNRTAIAQCEQIHTVDISRLTDYFGSVTAEEMDEVEAGMLFGLQINRGKNPQGIFRKYQRQLDKYPELINA